MIFANLDDTRRVVEGRFGAPALDAGMFAGFSVSGSEYEETDHASRPLRRTAIFFEPMSKRRKGFPSETQVGRGVRIVHGDKLLEEKLGRNDLCPCGSGRRFKRCCLQKGRF